MSVKDRLDSLELRVGEPNLEFPIGPLYEMVHYLRMDMRSAAASRKGLYERVAELSDDINELNDDINTLKEALPDVEDKINSLEARVEELENAEADTRWNAPDNSAKPEKFIKIVDDKNEQHMVRFPTIGSIKSYWGESRGNITFVVGDLWAIKTYFDKESWQHDLNKIEWFIYDDALLLDLTPKPDVLSVDLTSAFFDEHPKFPTSNHHDICPICKERMVYYATENIYAGEAKLMCTKCNYKES